MGSAIASISAPLELRISCAACDARSEAFLGQECFDVGDLDPDAAPAGKRFSQAAALTEVPGIPMERMVQLTTAAWARKMSM